MRRELLWRLPRGPLRQVLPHREPDVGHQSVVAHHSVALTDRALARLPVGVCKADTINIEGLVTFK